MTEGLARISQGWFARRSERQIQRSEVIESYLRNCRLGTDADDTKSGTYGNRVQPDGRNSILSVFVGADVFGDDIFMAPSLAFASLSAVENRHPLDSRES